MGTIKGSDEFATMWYYGEVSVNFRGINDGGIRMAEYTRVTERMCSRTSELRERGGRGKIGGKRTCVIQNLESLEKV